MYTDEFLEDFVEEAKSHIEVTEAAFLDKTKLKTDKEELNNVFRAVHSIKGAAGFFALNNIVALSHGMENVLNKLRNEELTLTDAILEELLDCNDKLKEFIEDVENSESADITPYIDALSLFYGDGDGSNTPHIQAKAGEQASKEGEVAPPTKKGKKGVKGSAAKNATTETKPQPQSKGLPHTPKQIMGSLTHNNAEKIARYKKQGHTAYAILYESNEQAQSAFGSLKNLITEILAYANIIEVFTPQKSINEKEEIVPFLEGTALETPVEFLITSVLEKELLCIALNLKEGMVRLVAMPTTPQQKATENVRVSLSLLNKLMALSSEMVLARNHLLNYFSNTPKLDPKLNRTLKNIDSLTSKMQESIMLTRMQPVGNLFNKFNRTIRDICKTLNKEVELVMLGKDTELDKTVIEALTDPLTHLIRNGADHGIESREKRIAQGKSPVGTIMLNAYYKGEMAVIEVNDDGGGIRVEDVKQTALSRGLITKEQAKSITDKQILKLILQPGFSTAKEVTGISGRGVGMDVVKTNIEKLSGSVEIESKLGVGTTITLYIPRTLAIINSLTVKTAGQRFVIPQANVRRVLEGKTAVQALNTCNAISAEGRLIPVIRLADILKLQGATEEKIVIITAAAKEYALIVDEVEDISEILVMPLAKCFKDYVCYSGITIMGDGLLSLILDAEGICELSDIIFDEQITTEVKAKKAVKEDNLILFKCSGEEAFAININETARIELIDSDSIDKIGGKDYAKLKNMSIRVVYLEDYLPVTKTEYTAKQLGVIVVGKTNPYGIVFERILDSTAGKFTLDKGLIKAKGLKGTCVCNGKITLVINPKELEGLIEE